MFADLVAAALQLFPEMDVAFRPPKIIDGELCFTFSAKEIQRASSPFHFSMVLKFLRQRPSLDNFRMFIRSRWGISSVPVVSAM